MPEQLSHTGCPHDGLDSAVSHLAAAFLETAKGRDNQCAAVLHWVYNHSPENAEALEIGTLLCQHCYACPQDNACQP